MRQSRAHSPTISKEYQISLRNFWSGRPRTAIEHLSKLLADDPDRNDQFYLYRLWIEILADLREFDSLRTLSEHMFARSLAQPEFYATYSALRGLIFYELDALEAAHLFASSLTQEQQNPYCLELCHLMNQRTHSRLLKNPFVKANKKISDYFHLQSLMRAQLVDGNERKITEGLKRILKLYPESPLPSLYAIHKNLDKKNFKEARVSAQKLYQRFSNKIEFAIIAAYAAIKTGDNSLATDILEKTFAIGGEDDVDATSLLGACYTDLYQTSSDEAYKEKGMHFLKKAATMLEDIGFSAVVPSYHEFLLKQDDESTDDDGEFSDGPSDGKRTSHAKHVLMVKLKPDMFFDVKNKSEDELCFLTLPMGEHAKPGDIVLLVGEDYRSDKDKDKTWRLAAVFTVASAAKWHPYNGFECCLQLISKPKLSIPLPVFMMNSADTTNKNVYELDGDAVQRISEVIAEYQDDSESERLVTEFSNLRKIS